MTRKEIENRMQEPLMKMIVPEERKWDYRWLSTNLFIENDRHEDFTKANMLLVGLEQGLYGERTLLERRVSAGRVANE